MAAAENPPDRIATRSDLAQALAGLCLGIGADHYMIAEVAAGRPLRIVASNWVHDTIEIVGLDLLGKLMASRLATRAGEAPCRMAAADLARLEILLPAEARLLEHFGCSEFYCLAFEAGGRRCRGLLSAALPGRLRGEAIPAAQLRCAYLLSELAEAAPAGLAGGSLSERERECLRWVAEGKTTDEVALILGVSGNTVNSYIQHAIRKYSAPNRAKAIATAIRCGAI
jgi:DNA-binding CsgD family transcriptional regulator